LLALFIVLLYDRPVLSVFVSVGKVLIAVSDFHFGLAWSSHRQSACLKICCHQSSQDIVSNSLNLVFTAAVFVSGVVFPVVSRARAVLFFC
jgi:hypothetical protein